MASELERFRNSVRRLSRNDQLLAHFYMRKESKINDPVAFFYFNLLSKDMAWQIKGTTGHGKKVKGMGSLTPLLNCWMVNNAFFKGFKSYYSNQRKYSKYRYAIIISRRLLDKTVPHIVEVERYKGQKVTSKNCWHYDVPKRKYGLLQPFHFCTVVRAKVPRDKITKEPILRLPPESIVGMMVQHGEKHSFKKYLNIKGMSHVKLFSM